MTLKKVICNLIMSLKHPVLKWAPLLNFFINFMLNNRECIKHKEMQRSRYSCSTLSAICVSGRVAKLKVKT